MTETLARIQHLGVVPIVRTPDAASASAAVEAVLAGGIDCIEITMTVAGAVKVIEAVADRYGDRVLLGAGTVLDAETARTCMLAGAQFFVTPSLNARTIEIAKRYGKTIFPGALTPTEILTAWEAGADGIKVFPCNALGGPKYIKSLKAPFPQVELIPTGGVSLETIGSFLAAGATAVGVGSELIDNETIAAGDFQTIAERCKRFRDAVAAFRASRPVKVA